MRLAWKQVFLAFLIGCLAGGFVGARCQKMAYHRFWQHGPNTQRVLQKFSRELGLDAGQQRAVKAVLDKQHEKIMALHQETSTRFEEIRKSMRTDIGKLLTSEQRKKFEAMAARWDARHKRLWGDQQPPVENK